MNVNEGTMEGHISVLAERMRGEMMVTIKEATWERGKEDFKRTLVLKMANGEGFNIQGLSNVLKRAWGAEKGVKIWEIPNSTAVARFDDEEKLSWVLDNGPWMFKGIALLMKRWSDYDDVENLEINSLKIWIQIHGIPMHVMTDEVAGDFARLAGRICKGGNADLDMVRRRFLRYQIELDVNSPIEQGCYLQRSGKNPIWVAFKYEKLPGLCKRCGSLRHGESSCPLGPGRRRFGVWLRAENPDICEPGVEEEVEGSGTGEVSGGAWRGAGTNADSRVDTRNVRSHSSQESDKAEVGADELSATLEQTAGSAYRHKKESRPSEKAAGHVRSEKGKEVANTERMLAYMAVDEGQKVSQLGGGSPVDSLHLGPGYTNGPKETSRKFFARKKLSNINGKRAKQIGVVTQALKVKAGGGGCKALVKFLGEELEKGEERRNDGVSRGEEPTLGDLLSAEIARRSRREQ